MKIHVLPAALLSLSAFSHASGQDTLVPHVSSEGPALHYDFPGIRVGVAEYEAGPTGGTVIVFDRPAKGAVDVRGGSPGTINTDALRLSYEEPFVNAITLAGGSSYGLSVATGVANALKERTANAGYWDNIRTVLGAIIFDLGGRRYNAATPDEHLGRAALDAARSGWVPLGARGAGRFAMQGYYFDDPQHSGQGAAFRQIGPVKVLVVTVVNAVGSIVDRGGRVVRCRHLDQDGCGSIADRFATRTMEMRSPPRPGPPPEARAGLTAHTTVTVVITNQTLPFAALQRLAVQVHNSMARAIQPFGTEDDGDTLFALTTGDVAVGGLKPIDLGVLASETAWDAILASPPMLPEEQPRERIDLAAAAADEFAGRYEFAPGVIATVRRDGVEISMAVAGADSEYLAAGNEVRLRHIGRDEFELQTGRADLIRFDRCLQRTVCGFTLNPGQWPVPAVRLTN